MKKLLIALIIILASILHFTPVFGAVSWSGNTCTITGDATVAQINACLTDGSTGIVAQGKTGEITVQLPADTQAWTSGISINMRDATYINVTSLIIKGAGTIPTGSTKGSAGLTILQASGGVAETGNGQEVNCYGAGVLFNITVPTGKKFRITNLVLGESFCTGSGVITFNGSTSPTNGGGFRADHIDITSTRYFGCKYPSGTTKECPSPRAFQVYDPYGVIDHNKIHVRSMASAVYPTNGNNGWAKPVVFGSLDTVAFEDNSTDHLGTSWPNYMVCDARNGARLTVRNNTIYDGYIGTHGFDGADRAPALVEAYNNSLIVTMTGAEARLNWRGGNFFAYNNTITTTGSGNVYENNIMFKYHRRMADYTNYPWGVDYCDATLRRACFGSVVRRGYICTDDANCGGSAGQYNYCQYIDGTGGYPCRDQIGVMNTHTTSTYSNTYQLANQPNLFWNNTYNGNYVTPTGKESTVNTVIQNNRDYCHSANTGTDTYGVTGGSPPAALATCNSKATTYIPIVYPHPLVSGATDTTDPDDLTSLSPTGQQACATNPSNVAISLSATDNVAVTGVRCCVENGSTCVSSTAYASRDVVLAYSSGTTWGATVSSACDTDIVYNCMSTDAAGNFSNNGIISYQMADNEDTDAPTMSTQAIGADGRTVTFTFSEAVTIGAGGNAGFTLTNGDAEEISLAYVSGAGSTTLTYQSSACIPSTDTFVAGLVYTQPTNGIEDMAGNDLASFSGAGAKTVTNGSTQSCDLATSLFEHPESAPSGIANASGNAVNLGVKFRTSVAASMTHCWFYKIATDTGTHVCTVYRVSDGSTVGTVDFADESESGWQDQAFASALNIAANEDYIVTVSHPTGNWTSTPDFFATTYTNGNLTATTSGTDYAGRYVYGATMAYPVNDSARNYWVDFTLSYADPGTGPWQCTVSRTGDGCMITGSQVVTNGSTCSATVTLRNGWKATWGGTCPAGSESGGIYTTGNLSADCTLTAACTEQGILP